jgi:hypothetical protein
MTHQLTDSQLTELLSELARVVLKKLFFLDALDTDVWQSMLMWRYDRGSHLGTARTLIATINRQFTIERRETYAVYHRSLLLVAEPR